MLTVICYTVVKKKKKKTIIPNSINLLFQVCALTGHGYTYAQTHRMSISFAASLRTKLKLQNDDKVAVILPNTPEYPCALLGVLEAGCIASLMNPAYTPREYQTFKLIPDLKIKEILRWYRFP